MGKASSSKKVARAARAGGRSSAGRQRNLLFPGVIGAIVLLGSALVWYAADERKGDTDIPPVIGDHWHAAVGIYVCGEWQPDIPEFENTTGIHTHGDGVIHIHPFSQSGAGENVQDEGAEPALLTAGLDDIRFRGNGEGYTIAFMPEDETDIPKPETAAN